MGKMGEWLRSDPWLRAITPDTVDETIRRLSRAWYIFAGAHSLLVVAVAFNGAPVIELILDPIGCAAAGYFLYRRKSRFLAVALFAYALLMAAVTVAARFGLTEGGRNVVLALVVVWIGWRGVQATRSYAQGEELTIRWRNVALVFAISLVTAVVVWALAIVLWTLVAPNDSGDLVAVLISYLAFATFVVAITALTTVMPFEVRRERLAQAV
ncbi:MAG: hypothetical protein BroJett029_37450 [Alphaproteobacteria bacterium]|nr:MAG: hypothetical protein BroJett029_37450 [Alphaproteobacteria bacterium]